MLLPFRLVYHEGYDLNLGDHVFPSQKFKLVRSRLLREGFAEPDDFVEPEPASDEDILLVHTPEWIRKLKTGTLTYRDIVTLEIPYSQQMVRAFWLAAGGGILAARLALKHGIGFNIGGGFHHAFPGHGEGFCAINDIAIAIRRLLADGLIRKAMVVDCDVHQGNGTAAIFAGDESVFTISIHQFNNYPSVKPPSTVDIHLPDGVSDQEYLNRLRDPYSTALTGFLPELLIYVAGADPYFGDQLGGLSLTLEGLKERDRMVMETALEYRVPVAVVFAGGYALQLADTITIHANTALAAAEVLKETGWHGRR
ncbi:MAG: histone deacetylase [Bryobacteraceae bacterium]|nr:histone deacetylase [Bryobacterales bacterium]MEB2361961.1 histone deacetylase [Bryobacterales bacterium]NUN00548.1 histone deacetylase [Bryobacteraceae bacterium]